MQQTTLFQTEEVPVFRRYLPEIEKVATHSGSPEKNIWKVPFTISQLGYLVHNHYRYYGKFPSVIAGQLLEQYQPKTKKDWVLDNFCGSGTTLVEAKLRGIKALGVDVSWLSVLASNVKVRHIDFEHLDELLNNLLKTFKRSKRFGVENDFVQKWFADEAASDLSRLSRGLEKLVDGSPEFDFLLVGFLAIVRRVSRAFDGEVRPHINKEKRQREVLPAFKKKISDMRKRHAEFMSLLNVNTECSAIVDNNINPCPTLGSGSCYLAISHPPYLNSFNYRPVYSLEHFWGKPFEYLYVEEAMSGLASSELRAHPANESVTELYFNHLKLCYEQVFKLQRYGGVLAVVIGDCTRNKKLIPVLDRTREVVQEIGYETIQINYRTTHYGLGKYAYKHRADYHGDATKKDGILVFRK